MVNKKSNGSPFWYLYPDTGKIFRLEKDISNSDSTAIGLYALRFGVNNSKEVLYPWSFSPVDLSRYETKFYGKYTKSEFQSSPIRTNRFRH